MSLMEIAKEIGLSCSNIRKLNDEKGTWIYKDEDVVYNLKTFECSCCGEYSYEPGRYCPHCGSYMEELSY